MASQSVANSVYKILRHQPVALHTVIDLLDRVYGRQSYRPVEDVLASLTAGELSGDTAQADAIASRDGEAECVNVPDSTVSSEQDSGMERKSRVKVETESQDDDSADTSGAQNATATKEYQQQNWATSWDSLSTENDKL